MRCRTNSSPSFEGGWRVGGSARPSAGTVMTCAPSHTATPNGSPAAVVTRGVTAAAPIERADAGAERVMDQVAREWLRVLAQRMVKEPPREATGDLHRGVFVLVLVGRRRVLSSAGADAGEAFVDDAHRTGSD